MAYKNNKTANRRRYKSRYHSPHNYKTKKSAHQYRIPIIVALSTFVVIASLVVVFTFGDKIYAFLDQNMPANNPLEIVPQTLAVETIGPDEISSEAPAPAEAETQAPTEEIRQPDEFLDLLKKANIDYNSLTGTQVMLVESSGTGAKIHAFQKNPQGLWHRYFDPVSAYVGEGGVKADVGPTDNATPSGTYKIEYAFGNKANPGTDLEYYPVNYNMCWVTDPASINYNLLCDNDTYNHDWMSAQYLYEYTVSYPYAVVFNYNRDPVDNTKGCAKFLHVSAGPTSGGGIGVSEADLYNILRWLSPNDAIISVF